MSEYKIWVILDTHCLLREEAILALKGVYLIIRAGDIDNEDIIKKLKKLFSVIVIRSNNDKEEWAKKYSKTEVVER